MSNNKVFMISTFSAACVLFGHSAMALSEGGALIFDSSSYFEFEVDPGFWFQS